MNKKTPHPWRSDAAILVWVKPAAKPHFPRSCIALVLALTVLALLVRNLMIVSLFSRLKRRCTILKQARSLC